MMPVSHPKPADGISCPVCNLKAYLAVPH